MSDPLKVMDKEGNKTHTYRQSTEFSIFFVERRLIQR